jgi:deferrochelatase/peroxidase EfeB
MSHAFVTIAIPFQASNRAAVEAALDAMGNPATPAIRDALRLKGIHFTSGTVVAGEGTPDHLLLEFSADGDEASTVKTYAECLDGPLRQVLSATQVYRPASSVAEFLSGHIVRTNQSLFGVPGLNFTGSPGMTVKRIREEWDLARAIRDCFDDQPPLGSPLVIVRKMREHIATKPELTHLLIPEPTPLLGPSQIPPPPTLPPIPVILKLAVKAILNFFWPLLVLGAIGVALAVWCGCGAFAVTSVIGFTLLLMSVVAGLFYVSLRRKEETDIPDNGVPDQAVLAEVVLRENAAVQNHLAGVSIMKAGWVRRFMLRFTFWGVGQLAPLYRPGWLGDIGTIHFARWVMLPGTNRLLFFSNYGGSWESYLEDFITKASIGLTGVWSNTIGFPKTENLVQKGASDGDRFKRWARRQQRPTRFWYSAYPHISTARIRSNAAVRSGLCTASTEDEAAAWLACFGTRLAPPSEIEIPEVQTILFGGLKHHPFSTCLLLRLPEDSLKARTWLADVSGRITFGDQPPKERVNLLALTASGFTRLGLPEDVRNQFSLPFRQGMDHPVRSRILSDTGDDKPERWIWGYGDKSVDAALLIYCDIVTGAQLDTIVAEEISKLRALGGEQVSETRLQSLLDRKELHGFPAEPFGFADGVSQPIIRGTRRAVTDENKIHTVEPGEFILGYPDNHGYLPLSPAVRAIDDARNTLPVIDPVHSKTDLPNFTQSGANQDRDLGRNGTYFVIRQLEQDVQAFNEYIKSAAAAHAGHPGVPPEVNTPERLEHWVAAKMIGRWKDGTSLVRFPHRPGTGWNGEYKDTPPDNGFLFGAEDPTGQRCPFGAHIRRANPRESQSPLSNEQLGITNRHRLLRAGRFFKTGETDYGLLFMCANGDLERQFEFIQQTWSMAPQFHGLENEVDPVLGRGMKMGRLTVPTRNGPLQLKGIPDLVKVTGGAYFFLPSRRAILYLSETPGGSGALH